MTADNVAGLVVAAALLGYLVLALLCGSSRAPPKGSAPTAATPVLAARLRREQPLRRQRGADRPGHRRQGGRRPGQPRPRVPADAVTSSGSGLDPDISPAYAELQVRRVAARSHLDAGRVAELVERHTDGRLLGFIGEPRVNVLELNIALRRLVTGTR